MVCTVCSFSRPPTVRQCVLRVRQKQEQTTLPAPDLMSGPYILECTALFTEVTECLPGNVFCYRLHLLTRLGDVFQNGKKSFGFQLILTFGYLFILDVYCVSVLETHQNFKYLPFTVGDKLYSYGKVDSIHVLEGNQVDRLTADSK